MESKASKGGIACPVCVSDEEPPISWWRLGVALVFAGQTMLFSLGYNNTLEAERPTREEWGYWALHGGLLVSCAVVIALLGPGLFKRAFKGLMGGKLELETLFAMSLTGAFVGSVAATLTGTAGLYYEVAPIVLAIYTLGKTLAGRSQAKVREAAAALRQTFAVANEIVGEKRIQARPVEQLRAGVSKVLVRPGEPIAVDGIVLAGQGAVRESVFTGEPGPVIKQAGDRVAAGTYAIDAELTVLVEAAYGERRLDKLTATIETAPEMPARAMYLADRLAGVFVPIVAGTAAATFLGWYLWGGLEWWEALLNAMAVLLVACPCALGLATPIAVASCLERLALLGVKPRAATLLDGLAEARTVVFDKTGTLTEDKMEVSSMLFAQEMSDREREWLLGAVAEAEQGYAHPVAETLAKLRDEGGGTVELLSKRWHAGEGVEAQIRLPQEWAERLPNNGGVMTLRVGTRAFAIGGSNAEATAGKPVYCGARGRLLLTVLLEERTRAGMDKMVGELLRLGIAVEVMSGDPHLGAAFLSGSNGQLKLRGGMTPQGKAQEIKELKKGGRKVLFVGDGINDAPALHAADCGLAVDSGTELAQALGHGVIGAEQLGHLPRAIQLARKAQRTLRENLYFALGYNSVGIGLAAAGLLHPAVAAVIMAASSVFVSLRAVWKIG